MGSRQALPDLSGPVGPAPLPALLGRMGAQTHLTNVDHGLGTDPFAFPVVVTEAYGLALSVSQESASAVPLWSATLTFGRCASTAMAGQFRGLAALCFPGLCQLGFQSLLLRFLVLVLGATLLVSQICS